MNSATTPIIVALLGQIGLAFAVFQANPKRRSNQCFLLLSMAICVWLMYRYFGLSTRVPAVAELCIRESCAAGAIILALLNLLRLTIRNRQSRWRDLLRESIPWFAVGLAVVVLCQTSFFIKGVRLNVDNITGLSAPDPIPGVGFLIFNIYFLAAIATLGFQLTRDLRMLAGSQRSEMAFIMIGAVVMLVSSVPLQLLLKLFVDTSKLLWLGPFRVVLFSLIIAYGISTRKIMDVGLFLRRAMSYAVLTAYLLALYGAVWWLVVLATSALFYSTDHTFAHIAAALAVTFAMAPARGFSQSLADRLFVGGRIDFRTTVSKATAILESVTTLPDLLRRFATTIGQAVGTDSVTIYLAQRKVFRKRYPVSSSPGPVEGLTEDSPLVQWLTTHHEPVILEELLRVRGTATTFAIRSELERAGVAAAVGILSREHLVGIMLLGPRLSGRIYGSTEQTALQVLCGQLGVAIDNAELFTEVQNARIYNEILVQNLTTGVVAADADGHITVFNQEAAQIAGLNTNGVERTVNDLPAPLREIIQTTLTSGERQEDREVELAGGTFARASSAIFRGQGGELLGALMVVTDITALKRLELQIRRSDRLASLGTLSAGMAHEIKNPLVSIKTFAQLLPERYHESDFRETFSGLIVHEIDRIDSLVNQLLRFARPAKPLLRPMHVHEILDKTLRLVQHRLYQKEIKVTQKWEAPIDTIRADGDQMEQVFLNFFLNAMDAMKRGGELTVSTETRSGESLVTHLLPEDGERNEALHISIRDTGEGIKKEDIARVFDPFFTTKNFGTGLGLSVVHGIIEEHGGQIEVESELAKGTSFHIFLPLVHFDQKVVAA